MKISDLKTTAVNVPLEAPIRWALGVVEGTTRTIVEVTTDEGITGLGETVGDYSKRSIDEEIKPIVVGRDPFDIQGLIARCTFEVEKTFFGRWDADLTAFAGVEMALWDIMGKAIGKPLCELLGGASRQEVPFAGYVFPRYREGEVGGESNPSEIASFCRGLIEEFGFKTLEIKLGVFDPNVDIEIVRAIRESVDDIQVRVDPNSVWSVETSIRTIKKMARYDVQNVEEPTKGLSALANVRTATGAAISTHSSLIPEIAALGAADSIVGDLHHGGGIWMTKKLVSVAEAFNLDFWLHSGCELGISTAACIHLAASTPHMIHANQTHYHHQVDDVISHGKFKIENGSITVPTGPGLGVELDEEKVSKYSDLYKHMGPYRFYCDRRRPDWIPSMPMW